MAKQLTDQELLEWKEMLLKHPSASSCIWTCRMLQTLDNGVKGGKWFSLKDKIINIKTLSYAFSEVYKNKGSCGVDKETIEQFQEHRTANLNALVWKLENDQYEPLPVRRVYIDKAGSKDKRPLGIPTIKQRVVENAIKFAIEPIFEKEFLPCSFGFRPKRGAKVALREVASNLSEGYKYVIDADIKGYFDTINHPLLMSFVKEHIADGWVLNILKKFLSNSIMEEHKCWKPTMGSPQGSVISPLLSNIYLHKLDVRMMSAGYRITRYADDFVVMCKTAEEAEKGLVVIKEVMEKLKLTLHPEKTKIVEVREEVGFDFLGYHFTERRRRPRDKSLKSLRMKIKLKTRRSQGKAIEKVIEDLNPTLRGWYNYFKHIRNSTYVFRDMDGFIRRRLRSILAKFQAKKGSHRMSDNFVYRNDFFHKLGLFCLQNVHDKNVTLTKGKL